MYNLNPISTMVVGCSSTINSSSLSFPSPNWIHHVFPSFHGPDVREGFLSHLLKSLKSNGIKPFIDNDIERSKSIGPELKEAIRGSRIAIVLLSKNYASSSWCLDELVEIMRCREVLGQIVITIFYKVQPTDIRKQTGSFGEAFKKTCEDKTEELTERWRKALEKAAQIAGMCSGACDNEAVMIEEITTKVSDELRNFTPPRDFKDLVGMSTHMEEIKRLFSLTLLDLNEVRMLGIWGPPGIGKTTIAEFLYHQLSSEFQHRAIMVNIKANYPTHHLDDSGARQKLQHQMLLQISNQKQVPNLQLALNGLKDKKVLLVLDDVDRIEQVHALAKEIRWFGPGSCIIITTENRSLLEAQGIDHIYKVKPPSIDEAFKIFCINAFGNEYPDDGFYDLAWEVTNLAGELPLGLKVLGSALKGMTKEQWTWRLPLLKTRLDGKIESIIKFSYDALHDEEKGVFLYIACLFMPYDIKTHKVEEILAKKFWNVKQSVDILVKKTFIFIEKGCFTAHVLLRQFGRETSRKQVKRELLIDSRDLCDHIDCSKLIGINLKFNDEELSISEKAVERMSDVQFVRIIGPYKRLQSLLYHSQMIRFLHWIFFEDKSLPSTFNPEYLLEVRMMSSQLEKLWEGNKPLKSLKWMDLNNSNDLKELPDLSTATNLEHLVINGCRSLRKLRRFHLSPQLSDSLTYIDASFCESLERLDCSFNNPNICLDFTNCFKLNQKARDLIMFSSSHRYAVLPGTHVPSCFNYRATDGGSLTINMNEMSLPTALRFKACITLVKSEERRDNIGRFESINIMVKNKRLGIYSAELEHIYTFEVEVNEVTSTELVFEFETDSINWKVGECGLLQIMEVPVLGKIGENEPEMQKEKNEPEIKGRIGRFFSVLSLFSKFWRFLKGRIGQFFSVLSLLFRFWRSLLKGRIGQFFSVLSLFSKFLRSLLREE